MNLHDTARVRRPRDAVEYLLGAVTDIHHAPHSTHVEHYRLRFPNGDERTYPAAQVTACTRDDDRAALVAAFTDACRSLRDACRIAHDYDDELSAEVSFLLTTLVGIAGARLEVTLDPASLTDPAARDDDSNGART